MAAYRAAGSPGLAAAGPGRPAPLGFFVFVESRTPASPGCLPAVVSLSPWTVLPGTSRCSHSGPERGARPTRAAAPGGRPRRRLAPSLPRLPFAVTQVCWFSARCGICCTARADTREGGSDSLAGWDLVYTGSGELKLRTETDPPFGREVCLPLVLSVYPLGSQ